MLVLLFLSDFNTKYDIGSIRYRIHRNLFTFYQPTDSNHDSECSFDMQKNLTLPKDEILNPSK